MEGFESLSQQKTQTETTAEQFAQADLVSGRFVSTTRKLLYWEHKFWLLLGIAMMILAASIMQFIALFLPIGIVAFAISGEAYKTMKKVDEDFLFVAKRCSSVFWLVVVLVLNNFASVFFLINFIRMKSNKDLMRACTE